MDRVQSTFEDISRLFILAGLLGVLLRKEARRSHVEAGLAQVAATDVEHATKGNFQCRLVRIGVHI